MSERACAASASIAALGLLPARTRIPNSVTAAALALCLIQAAVAQQRSETLVVPYSGALKQIRDSGIVRIGHRQNSPPFAFLDQKGKAIGYSLDLCEIVAEEIIAEVGKDVRVAYRPVTPENRFELVNSGEIDLECGSTTNNAERRRMVAFSPTIFVTGTKLLVRRGSRILNLRDLQGKTVVLTRGTVHETAIPKLAQRQGLAIKFVWRAGPYRPGTGVRWQSRADPVSRPGCMPEPPVRDLISIKFAGKRFVLP